MEIIDGIIIFSNPSTFFKWLWNYDGCLIIGEDRNIYKENGIHKNRKLIARLGFIKKGRWE